MVFSKYSLFSLFFFVFSKYFEKLQYASFLIMRKYQFDLIWYEKPPLMTEVLFLLLNVYTNTQKEKNLTLFEINTFIISVSKKK